MKRSGEAFVIKMMLEREEYDAKTQNKTCLVDS